MRTILKIVTLVLVLTGCEKHENPLNLKNHTEFWISYSHDPQWAYLLRILGVSEPSGPLNIHDESGEQVGGVPPGQTRHFLLPDGSYKLTWYRYDCFSTEVYENYGSYTSWSCHKHHRDREIELHSGKVCDIYGRHLGDTLFL